MQYQEFRGEQISRLGFGMMRLPVRGGDQAAVEYEKVEEMFLYAYGQGINYFDTAYPYHEGESERTLGRILEEHGLRSKVNIATKLFTLGMEKPDYDPRKMFEEQLRRLRTDHIDFYLMHGLHGNQWETLKNRFDIIPWLNGLRRDGVIRHIGFSFHDELPKFKAILDDYDWEFAQIQYNYVDHRIQAGDEGLAYAREKGVPLTIMEPLKGGSLIFPDYPEIEAIRRRHGLEEESFAALALRYVLSQKGLLTVLSGMSTLEQMKENIAIVSRDGKVCLSEEEKACIEEIRSFLAQREDIPCTACRYCVDGCPQHIAIPDAFRFYNEAKRFHNPAAQQRGYNRSCSNLADCVTCGQCEDACPQHLEIPELLKKVRAYLES